MKVIPEDAVCVICDSDAEYMVWGSVPMKTWCFDHLMEKTEGTCYVFKKDGTASFLIDGKFKV